MQNPEQEDHIERGDNTDSLVMDEIAEPINGQTSELEPESTAAEQSVNEQDSDNSDSGHSSSSFMFIPEVNEYYGESGTVEQTSPAMISPSTKVKFSDTVETLDLPVLPSSVLLAYGENFPNLDLDADQEGRDWHETYAQSVMMTPHKDQFIDRLKKPGSKFKQVVEYEGKNLTAASVKLNANTNETLSGEKAVYWVRSVTGQGGIIQIPLWHSGFWVSIKSPSEIALLELNARIAEDKIHFGRQTYGLAFSNATVFFSNHLVNFVFDHIFSHTVKDVKDIRELVKIHDINQLVWGMACAIWKNGFQYKRSIINEDNTVGKVINALLAVPKLCWTDNAGLTEWQKSHMAGRHGASMTKDSIEKYQKEFTVGHSRSIVLDEEKEISMELSVPFYTRYIESGMKWVNYLVMKADDSMRIDNDDGRRNEYVRQYGLASLLRQYCHWVKSVTVQGRRFEDNETIELLLDDWSADDKIRSIYFNQIKQFVDDTTTSIIAVPAVRGVDDDKTMPRFPYLVPIDPLVTFFTLLVQKVERIRVRSVAM